MLRITKIAKSKGLALASSSSSSSSLSPLSSIESLSSHFQQRCFASATKVKKPKPGADAKRSKITVRKGGAATSSSSKSGAGRYQDQNLEALCLNAPTPIRYIKPKERKREAEREKLGLISEARKREMEMLKKQAKQGGADATKDRPTIMGTPGLDYITLGIVDAELIPMYELTIEDGRRLAKEYSRILMRQHRKKQGEEGALKSLQKEAIEALPEHLKAAALVADKTPCPPTHFMLSLTPHIEGYGERMKEEAKKKSGQARLR